MILYKTIITYYFHDYFLKYHGNNHDGWIMDKNEICMIYAMPLIDIFDGKSRVGVITLKM